MHIKVEVTKQLKLQVRATVSIFTIAKYDKEIKSIIWTLFTRKTEESKLFLPHGSCLEFNSLFTKLINCN